MNRHQRLLRRILSGQADANIRFRDLRALLLALGFDERIRGSHHIYEMQDLPEIVTLQPQGPNAKRYQVRQLRKLFIQYQLFELLEDD